MQDATLVFLVRGNSPVEILVGLERNGLGEGKWNGFGGKVESNESVASAAARELKEECGIEVDVEDLHRVARIEFYFPFKPDWDEVAHAFTPALHRTQCGASVAHDWRGEPKEAREMKPMWFDTNAIPYDKMWADDLHWLPFVLEGKRVNAAFTFKEDNETVDTAKILLNADKHEAKNLC
jgi:8-oxo-dGTP diphosphatase